MGLRQSLRNDGRVSPVRFGPGFVLQDLARRQALKHEWRRTEMPAAIGTIYG
jgi:hypothetical protein